VPLYAHDTEVALVLLNWMGVRLDLRTFLGNDCIAFIALSLCNQAMTTFVTKRSF
jgi:hypothetical protein